jgi:hypothetical protein
MPSNDSKYDDLHKQLFEEGLKMRRSVVGDKYVDGALANGSTEFSREGQELVTEWCWYVLMLTLDCGCFTDAEFRHSGDTRGHDLD